MWMILIFAFFSGITGNTINFYVPYFNNNSLNSVIFEDELTYSHLLYPNRETGQWKINDSITLTKVPVLEANSLKQRDSTNHICINLLTPVVDTFNRIMLSFSSYGNTLSYRSHYLLGYTINKEPVNALLLIFRTSKKTYANMSTLMLYDFHFESEMVWKERKTVFQKYYTAYKRGALKVGPFYFKSDSNKYIGLKGEVETKNLHTTISIPVNKYKDPFYSFSINHRHAHLFFQKKLKYNIQNDTPVEETKGVLSCISEEFQLSLWLGRDNQDTIYGTSFTVSPSSLIGGGFMLQKSDSLSASMLLYSNHSFYNKELKYSFLLQLDGMKNLYYGVEILLFKNLVLRTLKLKNGDFIGIFVRLIN